MKEIKVVQCSGCGRYMATRSETSIHCGYCGKHMSMKGRRVWHKGYDAIKVSRVVGHLNYMREVERR